jgi:hypothetical protein
MNQPMPSYGSPYAPMPGAMQIATQPMAFAPVVLPPQHGTGLKRAYAALATVEAAAAVTMLFAEPLGLDGSAGVVVKGIGAWAFGAAVVVGLVWLAKAWGDVPPELVRRMSAGDAVIRLFIPFYGVYWMFAVHVRLCRALDTVLATRGSRRAPGFLAFAAALVEVLAGWGPGWRDQGWGIAAAVAAILWFLYMLRYDAARRIASAAPGHGTA